MEYRGLGNTNISVSAICLGTMTWGEQNSEKDAHAQLYLAADRGVNFFDTAEMYPVPPRSDTQGETESLLGSWLKRQPDRSRFVIATKVTGPDMGFDYIRGGPRLTRPHIRLAIESSLRRLQTDYVDLYQLHWPERTTNYFGQLGYTHEEGEEPISLEESLEAMTELVKEGKVRHVGLSNETPWGVMKSLALAKRGGLARPVSVQNPYSLLNRSYEVGLAEVSIRENCGLLAYSPLAFGVLTGKYLNGQRPANARLTLFDRFQRYTGARGQAAAAKYVAIAKEHGLVPAQMALAYINSRPFVTSNIIGATTLEQLRENIDSIRVKLSPVVISEIEAVHAENPNPCP